MTSETQNEIENEELIAVDEVLVPVSDPQTDMRTIEAVIFATREPMTLDQIQNFLPHLEKDDLEPLLARVRQDYDGRGVVLEEIDGRWAFRTAVDLAESLSALRVEERRLSRAAMETLAVIAYHQPVTRPEIEAVRGVAVARGTLDQLLEVGWVKPGRRREAPGRPLTWVTTPVFLDHFGLETIVDLPGLDDLKASGLLDRRPSASVTPDLFESDEDAEDEMVVSEVEEKNIDVQEEAVA